MAWNTISYLIDSVIIKSDRRLIDFKQESTNSFIQKVNFALDPYYIHSRSIKVRPFNLDCIIRSSSL